MFLSGSPQSMLCGAALGSSGKGSMPNGNTLVFHHNQVKSQRATWDLLRAAAGEVERIHLNEEEQEEPYNYSCFLRNTGKKPSPSVGGFYIQQQQQSLSHHQLQIAQFEMLRKQ